MGSRRPNHIDLGGSRNFDPNKLGAPSPHDLPSPRSGEAPPALSPLDAFAFHSSILARKFQEENDGRRISRLPPNTIAQELSKRRQYASPRPSQTQQNSSAQPSAPSSGTEPQVESGAQFKHHSVYPSITTFDDAASIADTLDESAEETPRYDKGYFGGNPFRSESPDPLPLRSRNVGNLEISTAGHARLAAYNGSGDGIRQLPHTSLAPPRSPASFQSKSPKSQSSVRPVRNDSGDDNSDAMSFLSDPYDSSRYERKTSATTASSRPRSPFSPMYPHRRSPSVASEASTTASIAPRKSMNFSRPMSPSNRLYDQAFDTPHAFLGAESATVRPSIDGVSLNDFSDSPQLHSNATFESHTRSNETTPSEDVTANGGSYIYAKYALPRGRTVPRNSIGAEEFLSSKFNWDSPFLNGKSEDAKLVDPPSDLDDSNLGPPKFPSLAAPGLAQARASMNDVTSMTPSDPQSGRHLRRPSADHVIGKRSMDALLPLEPPKLSIDRRTRKFSFGNKERRPSFNSSPRPTTSNFAHSKAINAQELSKRLETTQTPTIDQSSPEAHLAIGIECHEAGNLQKSTYHLRIAAKAGQPTAMLLYGLACRHGWGIRANPQEAFIWLRKAVDSAGIDVADDEALHRFSQLPDRLVRDDLSSEFNSRKSHKAQLALAFYELGVSYMNGWGVATDKSSAVRCFEIAGNWGDADALAEAGYCYAKGVGCKKDLARAAAYYRKAEDKGISMTGNSWIYKDKYNTVKDSASDGRTGRGVEKEKDKEKKSRDKSRTRALFGTRKKQQATTS